MDITDIELIFINAMISDLKYEPHSEIASNINNLSNSELLSVILGTLKFRGER